MLSKTAKQDFISSTRNGCIKRHVTSAVNRWIILTSLDIVKAVNMALNHASLFSGIGGFDLAAEHCGMNNILHCEWNPFGRKVLNYYWPKAASYGDITQTDFTVHRGTIDILSGGFPCQPYSVAGKRLGKEDERHLWPEMLRAIREIQPIYVVGENVHGLVNWSAGLVFDEVQADLENEGYEIIPVILPAAGRNAPHKRYRVFFVAYNAAYSHNSRANNRMQTNRQWATNDSGRRKQSFTERWQNGNNGTAAYAHGIGHRGRDFRPEPDKPKEQPFRPYICDNGDGIRCETPRCGADASDTNDTGLERCENNRGFGECESDNTQFSSGHVLSDWSDFPTQSPVCSGNDGVSTGLDGITISKWTNESIKAYGNAVVPQVVIPIFKAIISHYENQTTD